MFFSLSFPALTLSDHNNTRIDNEPNVGITSFLDVTNDSSKVCIKTNGTSIYLLTTCKEFFRVPVIPRRCPPSSSVILFLYCRPKPFRVVDCYCFFLFLSFFVREHRVEMMPHQEVPFHFFISTKYHLVKCDLWKAAVWSGDDGVNTLLFERMSNRTAFRKKVLEQIRPFRVKSLVRCDENAFQCGKPSFFFVSRKLQI